MLRLRSPSYDYIELAAFAVDCVRVQDCAVTFFYLSFSDLRTLADFPVCDVRQCLFALKRSYTAVWTLKIQGMSEQLLLRLTKQNRFGETYSHNATKHNETIVYERFLQNCLLRVQEDRYRQQKKKGVKKRADKSCLSFSLVPSSFVVYFLAPEEDNFCRKRSCTIVFLRFVALVILFLVLC